MISNWKLENFKSIGDLTELSLKPLTILAGPNSSGKSTILQSMLLIAQTLGNRISSRSVILNGPYVKLGRFNDLKSYGSENQNIRVGWELLPKGDYLSRYEFPIWFNQFKFFQEYRQVSCDLSIDADSGDESKEFYQLQPRIVSTSLSWTVDDNHEKVTNEVKIKRSQDKEKKLRHISRNPKNTILEQALEYDIEYILPSKRRIKNRTSLSKAVGVELHHFLPTMVVMDYSETEKFAEFVISIIKGETSREDIDYRQHDPRIKQEGISEGLRDILQEKLSQVPPDVVDFSGSYPDSLYDLVDLIDNLEEAPEFLDQLRDKSFSDQVRATLLEEKGEQRNLSWGRREFGLDFEISEFIDDYFLSKMKYLGPLREEPKPMYPLAGNDATDVGIKGEHTAAVLDINRDKLVTYIPSKNFVTPDILADAVRLPLKQAISDWLQYMDVASDVITRDMGKFGRELKVRTKGTDIEQDLTHVGVGVSQVLPILTLCLLAGSDSTIIIEQPELHLHPKVQSLLADFFLSMTLLGKQCILETHSEYLINRLRFRAAAADQDFLSSLLKIYFVEKKNGRSNFRSIDVNKYGAIPDWPEGFFDQSQEEAESILRAATQKRKKEK